MMKDKKCVMCGKMISYKDWCDRMVNKSDFAWNQKKYCDIFCMRDAAAKRVRLVKEKGNR